MADGVDRRYPRVPVVHGQSHTASWAESWRYDRERELVQQLGTDDRTNSGKAPRARQGPPSRGDRSVKQQQRRRELAEREKQRRMDLANAFDELAAMLSKIEPDEVEEEEEIEEAEEEVVNGKKRRKKAPPVDQEPESLGMNRLDLIGRTIDTLRRLHEENIDLKQHGEPSKGKEQEVLVMVPTHTAPSDAPPRGRLGPPLYPPYYQPGQGPPPPHHQSHPPGISQSASHDYHASPLPYYGGMAQGYPYAGGGPGPPWENAPPMPPHSPTPNRDSNTIYYGQHPQHHPHHQQQTPPQMHYPHPQRGQPPPPQGQRSDRPPPPPPPIGFLDVPKQMGPAAQWRLRPSEEEMAMRTMQMSRSREEGENWEGRPMFRQY